MPAAALVKIDPDSAPESAPESGTGRRPRLLLTAARHGMADYRRHRDLPRLIGPGVPPAAIIDRLTDIESRLEAARRKDDPLWSCLRHVEVLIALLSERAMRQE